MIWWLWYGIMLQIPNPMETCKTCESSRETGETGAQPFGGAPGARTKVRAAGDWLMWLASLAKSPFSANSKIWHGIIKDKGAQMGPPSKVAGGKRLRSKSPEVSFRYDQFPFYLHTMWILQIYIYIIIYVLCFIMSSKDVSCCSWWPLWVVHGPYFFVSRPRWDGAGDLVGKHGSDGGWADDDDDDDDGYQWLLYNGYIMVI